jgi:hypothetical protein
MILDGYAAYLLAKKRAEETMSRWEVWASDEGFIVSPLNERYKLGDRGMHIIIINPDTKLMTREEYMRWL